MTELTRVFLVDDHPLVLEGLQSVLSRDEGLVVVGTADSLAAARSGIPATRPDVVLTDERLPDGSGIELVEELASTAPPWFVMVTANDHVECVRNALDAGSRGYLLKDIPGTRLREAIHAVARGEVRLDPRLTGMFLERLQQRREHSQGLTWRDREVLAYLADGLTNVQISERMKVAHSTAKGYVTALLSRLGVDTRAAAVGVAARYGLLPTSDSTRPDIEPMPGRPKVMVVRR